MKNIFGKLICIFFSLCPVFGGAVLFVRNFPEDLIWNIFGFVLMLAGIAAVLSEILHAFQEKRRAEV